MGKWPSSTGAGAGGSLSRDIGAVSTSRSIRAPGVMAFGVA
jgi:hypothetical protein